MVELYKGSPLSFIKEAQRLDAPVTSATCVFKEQTKVQFNLSCCGGQPNEYTIEPGTLHQYVLSIANRDPAMFTDPSLFNPSRENLDEMLAWNGAISGGAAEYPRFCPGHSLSLVVIQTICSFLEEISGAPTA